MGDGGKWGGQTRGVAGWLTGWQLVKSELENWVQVNYPTVIVTAFRCLST